MNRNELIDHLLQCTATTREQVAQFNDLPQAQLNQARSDGGWSILECLEHLNRYGDFYLVEIEQRLLNAGEKPSATEFKPGRIGNYFAKMIRPKEGGKIKPMKTVKNMNPKGSDLPVTTVDRFLKQLDRLTALLESARRADLTRTKTGVTFTKMLKLRLCDTLRFVVYHNERHVLQAKRVMEEVQVEVVG